tara:strand:- start:232609 stop:233268 length:660 start_codon:yes stop_codon:yes gene_type:complete
MLIFFMVTYVYFLSAQKNEIALGLKLGIGVSNARGSEIHTNAQAIYSPNYALSIDYGISERVRISMDARIDKKGTKTFIPLIKPNGEIIGHLDAIYSFNYIAVPLLIKYEMGERVKLGVGAGGYISFLTSQLYEIKPYDSFQGKKTSLESDYSSMDGGLSFWLGTSFEILESLRLTFDVQNDLGLKNILTNPNKVISYEEVRLNYLSFMIGLKYNLAKK